MEKNAYRFPVKLFVSLLLLAFVPFIYQLIRTNLIANVPDSDGLSIAGHIEWFDLIDETLKAFLIMPLYALFHKVYYDKERFRERIIQTAILSFVLYTTFSVIVLCWCRHIVSGMGAAENTQAVTVYLRLETLGFILGLVYSFASVLFVIIGRARYVYALLISRTLATVLGDLLLIPKFGVSGVAYSDISVSFLSAIVCVIMLRREGLLSKTHIAPTKELIRDYLRIGLFSGGQIFLDNLIYALIVCKMVNDVAEQGNYWVANNVIWGLMLIPVGALSEIIKKDCIQKITKENLLNYAKICCGMFLVWGIFLFFLNPFLKNIMGIVNYQEISRIIYTVIPFYIAYTVSQVISSIFTGTGCTRYNLIVSILVNLVYYPIVYGLVLKGILVPSISFICLMFGFGMVFNMLVSIVLFFKKPTTLS